MSRLHPIFMLASITLAAAACGCVRRTATFTTVPEGALLHVNDEEVGRTPATVEFTWYGDYDLVYRLEGYEPVHTHHRIDPPWYQYFPIDFFAEVLWPAEIHDHHDVPTVELTPAQPIDPAELRQRAMEFRDQALLQNHTDAQGNGH